MRRIYSNQASALIYRLISALILLVTLLLQSRPALAHTPPKPELVFANRVNSESFGYDGLGNRVSSD
jgi:hypothetical protein